MIWLYLLAIALLGAVVVLLTGRVEGAEPPADLPPGDDVTSLLAAREGRPLTADDLRGLRLDPALRGYRMDQVEALLDALTAQLEQDSRERGEDTPG
ncbi:MULTISPECIES: DivIVA domain-containing protein [unclassified Nesterenkonia]|uniref:DivIVA domain-containing protein n=1 Tax=unclassified Nesterenkonia TaxID=2629769 RepID=UPI0009F6A377|nr:MULTISPECIES: DivIVA domain-containing protein [unclassified Nesterenkonia]MDS2173567.1 DivIVA domain-containing protein [Nesterenkonia sp. CL21]OSM42404.1 hypothetical protein BCY76_014690 [Nesterenkonia sp. PF2B19]